MLINGNIYILLFSSESMGDEVHKKSETFSRAQAREYVLSTHGDSYVNSLPEASLSKSVEIAYETMNRFPKDYKKILAREGQRKKPSDKSRFSFGKNLESISSSTQINRDNPDSSYDVFLESDDFYRLMKGAYDSTQLVKGKYDFFNSKPFFGGGERGITLDREISFFLDDDLLIRYFEKDLKVEGDSDSIKNSLRYVLGDDAQIKMNETDNSFEVSRLNKDLGQLTLDI